MPWERGVPSARKRSDREGHTQVRFLHPVLCQGECLGIEQHTVYGHGGYGCIRSDSSPLTPSVTRAEV